MNTFRVSNVEAFRRFLHDDDIALECLLADIRGDRQPSELMLAGTAFHKVLENAPLGEMEEAGANGFEFTILADIDLAMPEIRELRASKVYLVDGLPIAISGQVDAIEGNRIFDHKTTGRFDPERFMASYQWRLYLEIFGASSFVWNVFVMQPLEDEERRYCISAFYSLSQYRYPGMERDCEALVSEFARFVRTYMPEHT